MPSLPLIPELVDFALDLHRECAATISRNQNVGRRSPRIDAPKVFLETLAELLVLFTLQVVRLPLEKEIKAALDPYPTTDFMMTDPAGGGSFVYFQPQP